LHGKYKDLLDWLSIFNLYEGIFVAKEVRKKLDHHFNEEFHQRLLMKVTKKATNIMGNMELQKKLASININNAFNKQVSREALKRYHDMD
jgi:hypothetical protein